MLLNSKKSKIRELNQALEVSGSKATIPEPSSEIDVREETPPPAAAGPSKTRATRAKAALKAARKRKPAAPLSGSESDGFVRMDLDSKGKSTAALAGGDETEDTEDLESDGRSGDYLRQNELGNSDRSASEDEDELPPVRKPFEAFTLRAPEKRAPEPEAQNTEEREPKVAARGHGHGRARGSRGRGKEKELAPPPSPPSASTRGRGRMATRSKPAEAQSPSPPPAGDAGDTGEDTDDDEL